jgi:hypothetical protein
VVRWYQTPVQPALPGRIYLWLKSRKQTDDQPLCTILCRRPVEQVDQNTTRIPFYAVRWDGVATSKVMPITLRSLRSTRWLLDSASAGLVEQAGPYPEVDVVGKWMMPVTMPFGSNIILREELNSKKPAFTKLWDDQIQGWRFTLQATADDMLPAEVELTVQNGKLEDDWQFEASVPLVARPVRGQANEIIWTVQLAKPVKRFQIIMKPARSNNLQAPVISFPAWPGMVSP